MAKQDDNWDEQEHLTQELIGSMETMDTDEFEAGYAQLDEYHQGVVGDATREFQDNAIGWNDDDD
ncbi:hypothetical protein [Curtobacterium sp. MCBD17_040]|uniref:hypothetical protein n=1 Tax=Curtobacterium sp. MCBD17_040 TaxID=2175674 RepID=UPI000DA957AE|nr:hypothetical protein [Curtobacterium sp. MCBD17_040]WIB65706.1 hypothetical protein DEI94_16425 [Curtobacterium sp. MCBD17_040]